MSAFTLLIAAHYFDIWQDWLKESAGTTFERHYIYLRLWSAPIAALAFSGCWLILARFMLRRKNIITAALFLLMGISILFYPAIVMTFKIGAILKISVNYFGDSMVFFSSSLVAAIGLMGLLISADKEQIE